MALDVNKVSPTVAAWCRKAHPTDRRTVVVRVQSAADLLELDQTLERHDDQVESSGPNVITAVASARSIAEVSLLDGVVAIDEPGGLRH